MSVTVIPAFTVIPAKAGISGRAGADLPNETPAFAGVARIG